MDHEPTLLLPLEPSQLGWMLLLVGFAGLSCFAMVGLVPRASSRPALAGGLARKLWSGLSWTFGGRREHRAAPPRRVGDYALEQKIGEGGMGVVYRAVHARSKQWLALKLAPTECSGTSRRRFEKEGRLTARLNHPNTVVVYDQGQSIDGTAYYAMELLEGMTLETLIERHGPLPAGRAIHVLRQVCAALHEAHQLGLVHRDIKPANIYLCSRNYPPDFVKLLDFGLVRELGVGDAGVSGTTSLLGTPLYLSPESITAPDRVDARADIYGLGAVAYFLLTGAPPFSGNNAIEVCAHHLHSAVPAPSLRAAVPPDLEQVILACLAKEPEARPASAAHLARSLERCRDAGGWGTECAANWWQRHGRD